MRYFFREERPHVLRMIEAVLRRPAICRDCSRRATYFGYDPFLFATKRSKDAYWFCKKCFMIAKDACEWMKPIE